MKRVFVSEDRIKLDKKVRNEEIEENRSLGIEIKEEEYDSRPLFERLQEQKKKKEIELEEKFKTANLMSFVDNEDAKFIEKLSIEKDNKVRIEKERAIEEAYLFKKELSKKKHQNHSAPGLDSSNIKEIQPSFTELQHFEDKLKEMEKNKRLFDGIKRGKSTQKKEEIKTSLIDYSDSE